MGRTASSTWALVQHGPNWRRLLHICSHCIPIIIPDIGVIAMAMFPRVNFFFPLYISIKFSWYYILIICPFIFSFPLYLAITLFLLLGFPSYFHYIPIIYIFPFRKKHTLKKSWNSILIISHINPIIPEERPMRPFRCSSCGLELSQRAKPVGESPRGRGEGPRLQ